MEEQSVLGVDASLLLDISAGMMEGDGLIYRLSVVVCIRNNSAEDMDLVLEVDDGQTTRPDPTNNHYW